MFTWIINIFKKKKDITPQVSIVGQSDEIIIKNGVLIEQVKDPYKIVLNDSNKRINILKIYTNFFNNTVLNSIYNQTELIHRIFKDNKDLKYNLLEQFHYYYTDNLFELLEKIKKNCHEKTLILTTQINTIKEQINKLSSSIVNKEIESVTDNNKLKYSRYISLQLNTIYNCLIDNFLDFRFIQKQQLYTYSIDNYQYSNNFYLLPENVYNDLLIYDKDKNYYYNEYFIERRLMGKLQKTLFNITFLDVYTYNNNLVELYIINDTQDYFIYIVDEGIFKLVNYNIFKKYTIKQNTITGQLINERNELKNKLVKKQKEIDSVSILDEATIKTLVAYETKIISDELINNFESIDVERLNLESILELTKLDI